MRRMAVGIVLEGFEASPDVTPTISTPMNEYITKQQPSHTPAAPNGMKPPCPVTWRKPTVASPVSPTTASTPTATNSAKAAILIRTSHDSTMPTRPTAREFTKTSVVAKINTQTAPGTEGNQ